MKREEIIGKLVEMFDACDDIDICIELQRTIDRLAGCD